MSEWIDVRDRLPEPYVDVLAVHKNGYVRVECMLPDKKGDFSLSLAYGDVILWFPIPELPETDCTEVTRCNKCKYYRDDPTVHFCEKFEVHAEPDFYCAASKRAEVQK